MPDIFDDIKAGRAGTKQAPGIPPPPTGGDIFDQIRSDKTKASASSSQLNVNNIPVGHMAMTDPSGQLQAVPHGQVVGLMQKGYKIGPPQQQSSPVSAAGEFARGFVPDSSTASSAGGRAVDLAKGLGGLVNPVPDADMRQRIMANAQGKPQSLGDAVQGAVESVPMAGPLTSRLVSGITNSTDQAVRQSAGQFREAGKVKDDPLGKILALSRAGVTGASALNPLASGSVTNINRLEDEGKPKEALGAGATDIAAILAGPKIAKTAANVAQVAKIKALPTAALTPAEQVAKTAAPANILKIHQAAKVTLPDIQEASAGMGQPIQTVEHAVDAVKQAKTNVAIDAQAKLDAQGGGKTLADAPEEYHAKVKALYTMQDHLEDLAKKKSEAIESAAKAGKNVPATRGAAAGVLAKGMAKSAVGGVVGEGINAAIPGAGPVVRAGLDAVGLGMGGKDLAAGMRGLIKPSGVGVADALDSSVAGAFKPQAQTGVSVPQTPIGPDPFASPAGPVDPRVQAQPPAFTRPAPGSAGKVVRPDPAVPQPSEPYVSPRMAKIKAGGAQPETAPQESSAAKAEAKPPLSKKNQASANLAQRQRMGWRLGNDPPTGVKGSLDQFEKQYKGQYTESSSTVDSAGLLKKIGADDVIPRDKVTHIEKAWRAGEKVEPVKLYVDENNNILGADGRHRAQAAVNAGIKKIPIILRRVKSK